MRKEELVELPPKKIEDLWAFNGDSVKASKSSFSSLLTSKHRDFLLSDEGNQVLLFLSLPGIYIYIYMYVFVYVHMYACMWFLNEG